MLSQLRAVITLYVTFTTMIWHFSVCSQWAYMFPKDFIDLKQQLHEQRAIAQEAFSSVLTLFSLNFSGESASPKTNRQTVGLYFQTFFVGRFKTSICQYETTLPIRNMCHCWVTVVGLFFFLRIHDSGLLEIWTQRISLNCTCEIYHRWSMLCEGKYYWISMFTIYVQK